MNPDMPSSFWGGWIVVISVVSLTGLVSLIYSIYSDKSDHHQGKAEPVWDETLTEGSSAPPLWWFWMLFSALIFTLIYLMLYPGLGTYSGFLNWSHGKRVVEAYEEFDERFDTARVSVATLSLAEIQNDNELMETAQRIFTRECAACHGPEGRGQASMFPNLQDVDWQWGGSPEEIEMSIRSGRNANMIAWGAVLGEEGISNVAAYVSNLSNGASSSHPGKNQYDQMCVACHRADGAGNTLLGAPRLSDDIWLYGGDKETIETTLKNGRFGEMPAFAERLDETQIKLLVALLAR